MGIIPARAGFTPGLVLPPAEVEDHPRSRGVYRQPSKTWRPTRGSSPLARGLLRRRPGRVGEQRIIPARAGFTVSAAGGVRRTRDHPRSRGVYVCRWGELPNMYGSSPLARGLRGAAPRQGVGAGIIPARAGFTTAAACPRRASWDHPRSRGVYHSHAPASSRAGGSSPLARGLRSCEMPLRRVRRDHPRSREVYVPDPRGDPPERGSSPLARGLRTAAIAG